MHSPQAGPTAFPRWAGRAFVGLMVVAVALRCWTASALWLDETLTVNIAKLPLSRLPDALRHDGSPPLFYALLHVWMRVFGDSDAAARSLSSVLAIIALPLTWVAARRLVAPLGDSARAVPAFTVVLLGVSPFAVRYATEARMYTLLIVLVLAGMLALQSALRDHRRPAPLTGIAVVSGLLALTHYWALFLLAAVAVVMAWRRTWPVVAAVCLGTAAFMGPWLPVFLYQSAHTGTPWAGSPRLNAVIGTVGSFAGGGTDPGVYLGLVFLSMTALAVLARPAGPGVVELRWPPQSTAARLAAATFGAVVIGVLAAIVQHSGFAPRYAAVVLAPFLLVVAMGISKLPSARAQLIALGVCAALSLHGAVLAVVHQRSQAKPVAGALGTRAAPGDVVAYCPDQLAPATHRRLHAPGVQELVYPTVEGPDRVDWVDYQQRNKAADPHQFARLVLDRAGSHRVWYVWAPGYRTFGTDCYQILLDLRAERGEGSYLVRRKPGRYYEPMNLVALPAP